MNQVRATQNPPPRNQMRVLVVDDMEDAADSMAMLLTMYGFKVDVARACAGAESAVLAHPPDVVLMDIGLPGCDGYSVANRIRQCFPKPPLLIAVTGYGQASDYQRSKDEGFDHHLVKPADPQTILRLLSEYAATLNASPSLQPQNA